MRVIAFYNRGKKMEKIFNDALIPFVNNGQLPFRRLESLIEIKKIIDRISTKTYILKEDVLDLEKKYGVKPTVISWGDYFQTELATSLIDDSDEDFFNAIETVKFDMISSEMIFANKDSLFFEWVESSYNDIIEKSNEETVYTEEEEEILHLKILKDYYVDMGLVDNFTKAEKKWYDSFKEAVAI